MDIVDNTTNEKLTIEAILASTATQITTIQVCPEMNQTQHTKLSQPRGHLRNYNQLKSKQASAPQ